MARDGTGFVITVKLKPGIYQYKYRVSAHPPYLDMDGLLRMSQTSAILCTLLTGSVNSSASGPATPTLCLRLATSPQAG